MLRLKIFKQFKQQDFTLDIEITSQAQPLILHGPSGAGKSLILKMIAGLIAPDKGTVQLNGQILFDSQEKINFKPQQRQLGYMFQDYALFPHLTVAQNIAFGLTKGVFNPKITIYHDIVEHWLDAFQLQSQAHFLPSELSGGQRQRTALARALATEPKALLLDEPFSALDPSLRLSLRQELADVQKRLAIPMVLITHDPEEAEFFGGDCIEINAGRLLAP